MSVSLLVFSDLVWVIRCVFQTERGDSFSATPTKELSDGDRVNLKCSEGRGGTETDERQKAYSA